MFDLLRFEVRDWRSRDALADMLQEPRQRQAIHLFDNGYGVSVIQGPYTAGGRQGLYEIAVLVHQRNDEVGMDEWVITYETSLTDPSGNLRQVDNVLGFLDEEQVSHYMTEVSRLPSATVWVRLL